MRSQARRTVGPEAHKSRALRHNGTSLPQARQSPLVRQQRGLGNQAFGASQRLGPIQTKLKVGAPNDRFEQEADRVADQVMRMPLPGGAGLSGAPQGIQRSCAACAAGGAPCPKCGGETDEIQRKPLAATITPLVQRQGIAPEEPEEQTLQAKAAPGQASAVGPGAQGLVSSLQSGGQPLSVGQRAFFEPRFGANFGAVRVHQGAQAATAARSLGARAYTLGRDVVFGQGEFRPDTQGGRHLLAHELAHVAQNGVNSTDTKQLIRRAPEPGGPRIPPAEPETSSPEPGGPRLSDPEAVKPEGKLSWNWIDLLVYPLVVDIWKDIISQELTDEQKKEFKLKGTEGSAAFALVLGTAFGAQAKGVNSFGDFLESWVDHADELHSLAGEGNVFVDALSRIIGLNLESYLGSDLFLSRLKSHSASVVSVLVAVQAILSTVQAVKEPGAEVGEFEPTAWEKHLPIVTGLFNLILKEQIKAPDFFDVGPLKLKTHPIFAASEFAGGPPPEELEFEHAKGFGEGEGGEKLKLGLTLNVPQILALIGTGEATSEDIADLEKFRGWQGSAWFSFDRFDPTASLARLGREPEKKFKTGMMLGRAGFLGLFEVGGRYGGQEAEELTSWFLRGGFGYSGKKDSLFKRVGFNVTYTDWEETDILAPRPGGAEAAAGRAARITPFTKLEFGERHKFGIGAALSFVTGSLEPFNVSGFRGDFSYTYMGDRSEDRFPVFKVDFSSSVNRLDWWNPESPLMTGFEARLGVDRAFLGGRVLTGAGGVSEERSLLFSDTEQDRVRAKVPTSFIVSGGVQF